MGAGNPVEEVLRAQGKDPKTVFVFPSDVAAALWREESLEILGVGTVEARRFMAWDRFKAEAIRSSIGSRTAVSEALRRLYARDLLRRNAEWALSGEPLLRALLPRGFAASGVSFAPWISRLLPQLSLWNEKRVKAREFPLFPLNEDEEDRDLAFLASDYGAFLRRHALFEPSWERPPLADTGFTYVILFYEAIEDWNEYAPVLKGAPFIRALSCWELFPRGGEENLPPAAIYENAREELRSCALSIESLLAKGVPADRIAVSVPDLENLAPYLTRELSLRGIPWEYRAGLPLGGRAAGRIFRLLDACGSENFSFASLKALLLDRLVPWNAPSLPVRLVSFGVANRCVTSWSDGGSRIDPWEEAFRDPVYGSDSDESLRAWYRALKRGIRSLRSSSTFTEIRNRWFAFRNDFFDMGLLSAEDDAVLARCVTELNALAALETEYAEVLSEGAWTFFLETLDRTTYVPQRSSGGVNLFPWRVAAGTPFPWHFALDMTLDRAAVVYRQLAFLREDKREALRSLEDDATGAFLAVYAASPRAPGTGELGRSLPGGGIRFSASLRGFQGYSTPLSDLLPCPAEDPPLTDPFRDELALASLSVGPDRLYPVQAEGWRESLRRKRTGEKFSYLTDKLDPCLPGLAGRIRARKIDDGALRVTQTDLALHSVCPTRWFLATVLAVSPPENEAALMDDRSLGIVYHEVFKNLYARIRKEDGAFLSSHLEQYFRWAEEAAETAARDSREFRGPLAAPVLSTLVTRIARGVQGMLREDARYLDGYIPEFLEEDISFTEGGIRWFARVDRISRHPAEGKLVLIDWKTGKTPSLELYRTDLESRPGRLADFQMPLYIFLAEESPASPYRGARVSCAWFGSVKEGSFVTVVDDSEEGGPKQKRGVFSRPEFEGALGALKEQGREFERSVRDLDFRRPRDLSRSECARCDYAKICRRNYTVAPE